VSVDKDGHKTYEIMFQVYVCMCVYMYVLYVHTDTHTYIHTQGFWDKTLTAHLLEDYQLPKACLEVSTLFLSFVFFVFLFFFLFSAALAHNLFTRILAICQ